MTSGSSAFVFANSAYSALSKVSLAWSAQAKLWFIDGQSGHSITGYDTVVVGAFSVLEGSYFERFEERSALFVPLMGSYSFVGVGCTN